MKKVKSLIICGIIVLLIVILLLFDIFKFFSYESRVNELENFEAIGSEEVVGWLQVQGTNIDYPILYNSNELDISEFNEYDFAWINKNDEKLTNRVVITGHNYLNVSSNPVIGGENHVRFEQMMGFVYPEFVEENKYIVYTKNDVDYVYEIFSVGLFNDYDIKYSSTHMTYDDLEEYIDISLENSFYDFDVDVDEEDFIISLVTCTRMFGIDDNRSIKIDARLVEDKMIFNNYDFNKNDNYGYIENAVMKGGVDSEI